jgi:hypothetical protein
LVHRFIEDLDDEELIEADRSAEGKCSSTPAAKLVDMSLQILWTFSAHPPWASRSTANCATTAAFTSAQQPPNIPVVEQADVVMTMTRSGLIIQADGLGRGEVLLGTGVVYIVIEGAPGAYVADAQQLGNSRIVTALRRATTRASISCVKPLLGRAQGTGTSGAAWRGPRNGYGHLAVEVGLVLKEIRVAPSKLPGVIDRLLVRTALGAGETCPRGEGQLEIDAALIGVKADLPGCPRCLQAECDSEQRKPIQDQSLKPTACGFVHKPTSPLAHNPAGTTTVLMIMPPDTFPRGQMNRTLSTQNVTEAESRV